MTYSHETYFQPPLSVTKPFQSRGIEIPDVSLHVVENIVSIIISIGLL